MRPRTGLSRRPSRSASALETRAQFAADIKQSLALEPRQLPSQYLYDDLGSALFEAICQLPWYQVTRAETRLIDDFAADVLALADQPSRIVELGPGSGEKLERLVRRGHAGGRPLSIHLVDVSASALTSASLRLSAIGGIRVTRHERTYEEGLALAMKSDAASPTLVLLLGSNIGNFSEPDALSLLQTIRAAMGPGDSFLMGVDLVKPEDELRQAYDDPLGVSAAFNLNVLLRINRELGGNFDLRAFRHHAVWNAASSRMDMYLVSTRKQRVRIAGVDLEFDLRDGEAVWTESSYKYTPDGLIGQLGNSGFESMAQWIDRDAGFALTLARTT